MLRRLSQCSERVCNVSLCAVVNKVRLLADQSETHRLKAKNRKTRLDQYLIRQYPQHSEKSLKAWILCRKVRVDNQIVDKPATLINEDQSVHLEIQEKKYVSRAGYKLEAAFQHFGIAVEGKCCLDAGIGTGGFTDCLLQHGALKVYGIDVGYGDVDYNLRMNPRLHLLERTNLRYLDPLLIDQSIDLATLDLSFISVLKVIPVVSELLSPQGELIILIKPQFEARRTEVEDGGRVTNPQVHNEILQNIRSNMQGEGFGCEGIISSPLKGKDSENVEYLGYFKHQI